jgi:RHS repeat-associated protein
VYLRHGQIAVAMDVEVKAGHGEEKVRTNRYVLSGDLIAGRVTKVLNADNTITAEKSWHHLDHLNSTKAVTDEDGAIVVSYVYRAFGEQLRRLDASGLDTDDKAKYSYGGKELDSVTNLYYFNARYYDATIGRFINVDPIQDGSNWYVYAGNNPLSLVDPTGLEDSNIINLSKEMSLQIGPYVIRETKRKPELNIWKGAYSEYMIAKNAAYIAKQISLNENLKAAMLSTSSSTVALIGDFA